MKGVVLMKTYEVCYFMSDDKKEYKTICKGTKAVKDFVKSIKNKKYIEEYAVYKNENDNLTRMWQYE